ncbi:hypothetical protein [[Phormidium] sp. ETS-05]|uniref:hypothetical protein n=1 Tax=[Phormidium] sp. ETS-05 TaxID=222819 RepID=UPI0018EEED08|nr:hypothetical protein [[Phormidium] sp. ETS-05]
MRTSDGKLIFSTFQFPIEVEVGEGDMTSSVAAAKRHNWIGREPRGQTVSGTGFGQIPLFTTQDLQDNIR